MSNRNFRDNGVDFAARRQYAEGNRGHNQDRHQAGRVQRFHQVDPLDQVLAHEDRILSCKQLLNSQLGEYHLFEADFCVEQHSSGEFALIKFLGGTQACELRKAGIRPGYFVPVNMLWHAAGNTEYRFRDDDQMFMVKFLLAQEALHEAMVQLKTERAATKKLQVASTRESLLAKYDTTVKPVKAKPPALAALADLLRANYGVYSHESGVDIWVGNGPKDRGTVFRVQNAPEDHPLAVMEAENIFCTRYDVATFPTEKGGQVEGKAALARQLREWLRAEFRAAGLMEPAPAVATMAEVNAEHAEVLGDTISNDSPKDAVASMAAVDAEHAQAHGDVVPLFADKANIKPRSNRKARSHS